MKKIIIVAFGLFSLISLPLFALVPEANAAATTYDCNGIETSVDFHCNDNSTDGVSAILMYIINFMAIGVGIAVVVGIIFGGIKYASSDGEEAKAKEGREIITNSIIGLFLFIFLYAGANFLIPGGAFNLNEKPKVVEENNDTSTNPLTEEEDSNGIGGSGSATSPTKLQYSAVTKLEDCSSEQAMASDETYLYLTCANSKKANRPTHIRKLTLAGKEVKRSETFYRSLIGHANDMAYNSATDTLIVNGWDEGNNGNKKLLLFDPNTLKLKGTTSFKGGPGGGTLCYNSVKNQYFSMSRGSGGDEGGYLYDSNFKKIKLLISKEKMVSDLGQKMGTGQGVECTGAYIYVVNTDLATDKSRVLVYDWSGKVTGVYETKGELENVVIANGVLYGLFNYPDEVIKITNVPT